MMNLMVRSATGRYRQAVDVLEVAARYLAVSIKERICATSSGLTHCLSRISSAVTPPPQRVDFEVGRSTKDTYRPDAASAP